MRKISTSIKENIVAGSVMSPTWSSVMSIGLIGQSINSVLSLINQIVYNNNPNPYYNWHSVYNDSASRLFVRAQNYPSKATMSFGNPFL